MAGNGVVGADNRHAFADGMSVLFHLGPRVGKSVRSLRAVMALKSCGLRSRGF
jgi:hypothetical protein